MNRAAALKALERMEKAEGPGDLGVGLGRVSGAGWRVVLRLDTVVMHMSAAAARRLARDFETPQAKAADLGQVADWLRETADELDAMTATRQ